jgi:serine/threonine protein kinase
MTHEEFQARYKYNYEADLLGEGGFGEVFKAYDTYRDRWIAIKVSKVRPELEAVRLKKEVEMVSRLPAHPNIAFYEDCYTFREMSGEYDFGILQYYEHGNLQQLLQREKLTDGQKHSLLRQILAGILFLHANGIIHRDLKPQNILIVKRDSEYIPKITDFGISKQLDVNRSSVFNNSLAGAGTLAYSSPEQLGDREIRKNTDLWSFGVIAFQTLTGALPFTTGEHASTGESGRMELFRQISTGTLPESINAIPELWQELIRRCLTTAPDRRIKDVAACLRVLNGESEDDSPQPQNIPPVASQEQPTLPNIPPATTRIDAPQSAFQEQSTRPNIPAPAPTPKPAPANEKKRRPALMLIVGGLAAALLGVIAVLLWQHTMNSSTTALTNGKDSTAQTTEPAVPSSPNNAWEESYNQTVKSANTYYNSKKYAEAKVEYNKALAQIPETDTGDRRNTINGKIADCDKQLKADADRKQQAEENYAQTVKKADTYYNNKKYAEAKAEYNKALAQIPTTDTGDRKNAIKGKVADCDKQIKEEKDRKQQTAANTTTSNTASSKEYDETGDFHYGELAWVKLNGKYGYIDTTGKEVIPLKYDYAQDFEKELAIVELNGKWGYIDKTGNEVIPIKYDNVRDFEKELATVELNGKWGFIDKAGQEVIPLKYDAVHTFSEGLARAELNGKWGFIDKTGKEVIPFRYDNASFFSGGLASVKLNGKWGYIDKTGKYIRDGY